MVKIRGDQAEGLRRMLGRGATRTIMLVSARGGVGKTSVAINLAAALAEGGSRVLLIDENRGMSSLVSYLGLRPGRTQDQPVHGARSLESALLPAGHGLTVLPAAEVSHASQGLNVAPLRAAARERLAADVSAVSRQFDIVLVDTACRDGGIMDLLCDASHDTIVVSSASAQSVTASYALIKRLHGATGQGRIHALLNRVVREDNARVILDNLINVARHKLQLPVQSLGCVPKDELLRISAGRFRPAIVSDSNSRAASRFRALAKDIALWPDAPVRAGLLDRFMQRVLCGSTPVLVPVGA